MAPSIHSTAVVHARAQLADDAVVGPYCVVEEDTVIGPGNKLDPFVRILPGVTLGSGNHVHTNAVIGGDPQHLTFSGEGCRVEIGDNNEIREFVTIHRGTKESGGVTRIGSNCLLMAYAHVAHDCRLGDHVVMANAVNLAGHAQLGNHVTIGGVTGVHQWARIGDYAFLGAVSALSQDIPPYLMAAGNRATLRGPNLIGLRRHKFSREAISAIRNAYRMIFRSETPRQDSLNEVEAEYGHLPEIVNLVEFIRGSERGVATAAQRNGED